MGEYGNMDKSVMLGSASGEQSFCRFCGGSMLLDLRRFGRVLFCVQKWMANDFAIMAKFIKVIHDAEANCFVV